MISRRLCLLALVVTALASVFAASAGAAQVPRFVTPKDGMFFTAAPVTVQLKTAKSVRSLQVSLDGKRVDGAFKRVGAGVWKATLAAKRLKRGTNNVAVWARPPGGRWRYASTRFVLGRHDGSLLSVTEPGRAGTEVSQVRVARKPVRLTAKLNGKRLRWPLGLNPLRRETLRLGGDDGLHFGVNRLRVFAIGAGDVYDAVERKVVVTRGQPLVGAGADRRTFAGRRVRLDGTSSEPAHGATKLSYRWQIVRRPPGSKATLRAPGSARPSLLTDQPGRYAVKLSVTERGPRGSRPSPKAADVMTLISRRASLPPIGEEIETMVSNGKSGAEADSGIRVGERIWWMGAPQGKTSQALILDRETLEPLYEASYGTEAEAGALNEEMAKYGSNGLTIISVPNLHGNAPRNVELGLTAADIGAENTVLYPKWQAGWSAIGVLGTKQGGTISGGANVNPKPNGANYAGDIAGYLQWASGNGFVFVPGSRVVFETDASGAAAGANKMVVGGREYPSQPLLPCGEGGFQIQVLAAETLAPVEGATFTTKGCGAPDELTEQTEMAAYLKGITVYGHGVAGAEGPKLVLVQSIGQPYGPFGHAWNQIAAGIEAVGGVGAAFAINEKSVFGLGKTGYALVGSVGVSPPRRAEASELWTGDAAKISGVLKQNQASAYVPELFSPIGREGTYEVSAIAYRPPEAWPYSSSAGDKAALRYIAEDVLELEKPEEKNACYVPPQPDVRSMYCDGQEIGHWDENARTLQAALKQGFPSGHGFGRTEWEDVAKQLAEKEFKTVEGIWQLLRNTEQIFVDSNSAGHIDFELIAAEIEKAIQPRPQDLTVGWWLELIGNLSSTGSYFSNAVDATETLTKGLGALQGAMFEGASSLFEPDGEPILDAYKVRTQELAKELAKRYEADIGAIAKVGEILVSDPGKLHAMQESGLLGFKPGNSKELIGAVSRGTQMWAYEGLLPSAYEALQLEGGGRNPEVPEKASTYVCEVGTGFDAEPYEPFRGVAEGAESLSNGTSPTLGVLVRDGSELPETNTGLKVYPQTPPASLLAPLVEPKEGTLGYVEPWFWHDVFDFPSGKNRTLGC